MTSKYYIFPWHSTLCLSPGLIDYEPAPLILRDSFTANSVKIFAVLTHPSTRNELRTYKQKLDESFQQYYHRFAEIRAQVFDITDREVIDHFANGIKYKW